MYDASGGGSIGAAVGAFAGAAASGMVSIDPDAAQTALTEIGNVKIEIETLLTRSDTGEAHVELGANPVGQAMAKKSMDRFSGTSDSFIVVLHRLLEQTESAERALKQAIQNYRGTDDANAAKYRG